MMRNNGLLKWTLHKNKNNGINGKNWVHPADSLTNGHVAYLVKFLGVTEAEQPKGIEVVKDSIRKLKLDEEIRRSEGGKTPKAEVTISVEGVAVQEAKGKKILHQFPLHQISYCADDKEEKKFFSFIAKDGEIHRCFVFVSEKLAEEITLTIGQAFDLAYKRFLDSSGRELELKREIMILQKRVSELENENMDLKGKLSLRSMDGNSNSSLSSSTSNIGDLMILPPVPPRLGDSVNVANQIIAEFTVTANEIERRTQVGKRFEGLLIDDDLFGLSKPRGTPDGIEATPRLSPPPPKSRKPENGMNNGTNSIDVFGSDPFFTTTKTTTPTTTSSSDPFGMSAFGSGNRMPRDMNGHTNGSNGSSNNTLLNGFGGFDPFSTTPRTLQPKPMTFDNALHSLDKRIEEMKVGFSRGILHEDFPLEMLDPLRQTS